MNVNRIVPHCLHKKVQIAAYNSRSFAKLTPNYLNTFIVLVPYLAWVVAQSFSNCGLWNSSIPEASIISNTKHLMLKILHGEISVGNVSYHIPNPPIGRSMINGPHWSKIYISPIRVSEKFCSL